MEKFIIRKIKADFEERWITVEKCDDKRNFRVYFVEFSEDAHKIKEHNLKRKIGSLIEGELFIGWVTKIEKIDSKLMYEQDDKYESIHAVVEILKILNKRTFYAKNSIVNRDIVVKTEKDIKFSEGDRVSIHGTLQLELEEYKDKLELLEY